MEERFVNERGVDIPKDEWPAEYERLMDRYVALCCSHGGEPFEGYNKSNAAPSLGDLQRFKKAIVRWVTLDVLIGNGCCETCNEIDKFGFDCPKCFRKRCDYCSNRPQCVCEWK